MIIHFLYDFNDTLIFTNAFSQCQIAIKNILNHPKNSV
jgi:hypothetical protein